MGEHMAMCGAIFILDAMDLPAMDGWPDGYIANFSQQSPTASMFYIPLLFTVW